MKKKPNTSNTFPPQHQDKQPGLEKDMSPSPKVNDPSYIGSGKLKDKVCIITGGDSGIGKATAICFAKEGADCVIVYYDEHQDAEETKKIIEQEKRKCLLISGDLSKEDFCLEVIKRTVKEFGKIDVLVNNAATQFPQENILSISTEQWIKTFETNIFSYFWLAKAAYPYLKKTKPSVVINTTSVTAYRGSEHLLDYSTTKGAIVSFTRSLALMLVKDEIRVNAVAPGPIWTPLIPSTFSEEKVKTFGSDVPMGRAGEPCEIAPAYVFLASKDSSYMTGQVMHLNGGEINNT